MRASDSRSSFRSRTACVADRLLLIALLATTTTTTTGGQHVAGCRNCEAFAPPLSSSHRINRLIWSTSQRKDKRSWLFAERESSDNLGNLDSDQQRRGPSSKEMSTKDPVDNKNHWQAGADVEGDFQLLEKAIAFANAEHNLQHLDRLDVLDYHAQQRRSIARDLNRFFMWSTAASGCVAVVLKASKLHSSTLKSSVQTLSLLHFYSLSVIAPILLYFVKRQHQDASSGTLPDDLRSVDRGYLPYATTIDWKDPNTSCDDYILCLLEQWVSTVAGIAVMGPLLSIPRLAPSWTTLILVQLLTRLAVVASWNQYPKLWYQLVRDFQPRPFTWSVWAMRSLERHQYTRWMVGLDVACLAATQLSTVRMVVVYGTALALLACVSAMARSHLTVITKLIDPIVARWKPSLLIVASSTGLLWIRGRRQYWIDALFRATSITRNLTWKQMVLSIPWKRVLPQLGVILALVGPLCHLFALAKLVRVSHTHNLSLGMGTENFQQALRSAEEESSTNTTIPTTSIFQWRYKLSWREPERLHVTLEKCWNRFWFWLLLSGSVQEKMRKELKTQRKTEIYSHGSHILDRVAIDRAKFPDAPKPNADKWKENAMENLRIQHQNDYANGFFRDPLGIAVQQTFDIGLGFNFDHMSDESDVPYLRRLQARAAKSAIKRVQELYDAEAARKDLESISDPIERNKRKAKLRQQVNDEFQRMARGLTELIPNDRSLGNLENARVEELRTFQQMSHNELVVTSSLDENSFRSPILRDYYSSLKNETPGAPSFDIDYLNPMGNSTTAENLADDEEFLDEWLRQQAGRTRISNETDQNETETFLV